MTAGAQVVEALQAHSPLRGKQAWDRALELFRQVRIPSPELRLRQYPHQMSGGQRQRVMIAMAFATEPDLLIADEPTTALDVTVQAQILALMSDLRARTGTAILLITHDLGVVAETCDRVLVMYAGEIVEEGTAEQVFHRPQHPYTQGLLRSLPNLGAPPTKRLATIPGQPPDLISLGPGCAFAPRCDRVMDRCRQENPTRSEVDEGQAARCHLVSGSGAG
jgi:oligopeptide/dipeptide ABC transporter ATP-binding protein